MKKRDHYSLLVILENELLFFNRSLYNFYKPYIDYEKDKLCYDFLKENSDNIGCPNCFKPFGIIEDFNEETFEGTVSVNGGSKLFSYQLTDEKLPSGNYKVNYTRHYPNLHDNENCFPNRTDLWSPEKLCDLVGKVKDIVSIALAIRGMNKLKIRQPLNKLSIICSEEDSFELSAFSDDFMKEVNVESLDFVSPDKASDYVSYNLKPNFKVIGTKFKSLVPAIKQYLSQANSEQILSDFNNFNLTKVTLGSETIELTREDVEVQLVAKPGYASTSFGKFVVLLDTTITPDLRNKAIVRDVKSAIQSLRRDANLAIQSYINVGIVCEDSLTEVLSANIDYVQKQTLANSIYFIPSTDNSFKEFDLDDNSKVYIKITPASTY